jgi:hypothetical protein
MEGRNAEMVVDEKIHDKSQFWGKNPRKCFSFSYSSTMYTAGTAGGTAKSKNNVHEN